MPALRPDGRAALGDQHGQLRQWRRLLSLFLFGGARLRPDRAGGHLRPRLPADRRGAPVRHHAAAAENPPRGHGRALMGSPAPIVPARDGIIDQVKAAIGAAFLSAKDEVDEVSIDIVRDSVADVLATLRDAFEYQQLMEIAGVDYP